MLRQFWVLIKLLITVVAAGASALADVRDPGPALHVVVGLLLLLVAAALSIYKPRGRTRYGWRKQQELLRASEQATARRAESTAPG